MIFVCYSHFVYFQTFAAVKLVFFHALQNTGYAFSASADYISSIPAYGSELTLPYSINRQPSTVNRSRREHITSGYLQTDCILQSKTLSVFMYPVNQKELPLPSTLSVSSPTVAQQVMQQSDSG